MLMREGSINQDISKESMGSILSYYGPKSSVSLSLALVCTALGARWNRVGVVACLTSHNEESPSVFQISREFASQC